MSQPLASEAAPKLTAVQWLICFIASIGFAFDIYELLMLPLIVGPALEELGNIARGTPEYLMWVGRLFYIPAFVGGIFGLLGGYLTDRLGRRRVLTWSILLYAFSAFFAGYSTSIEMLLVLRCTTFIGVCVEFVAAVAWLAELFPNPRQRENVLGYTQAFSSVGGLLVAVAYGLAVGYADLLPAIGIPEWASSFLGGTIVNPHAAWRYTLMSGLIPAIPLILIRPFLPESPAWQKKREAGTLRRPSLRELFSPALRRTSIMTMLMFACSYGAAFGAIQHLPRIIPGLPEVEAKVNAAMEMPESKAKIEKIFEKISSDPKFQAQLAGKPEEAQKKMLAGARSRAEAVIKNPIEQPIVANVTKVQEIGGLFGRFILAILAVRIVSRRKLLHVFLLPGLIVMPLVFGYAALTSLNLLYVGIFLAALVTVGQFSFWGNYLPRVYPVHLRGTGESFAANIGGRMIGTSFAWVTTTLAAEAFMPGAPGSERLAYTAAIVGTGVFLAGSILCFWLPEPGPEDEASE